jgi:hypothetical protein
MLPFNERDWDVIIFCDEAPPYHSLKAFCATPMMLIDG